MAIGRAVDGDDFQVLGDAAFHYAERCLEGIVRAEIDAIPRLRFDHAGSVQIPVIKRPDRLGGQQQ